MERLISQNPPETFMIIFDECSMLGRAIFGAVINRLIEAKIDYAKIAYVFFGDPAQCEPIGDLATWSIILPLSKFNKTWQQMSRDGLTFFRQIMGMERLDNLSDHKEWNTLFEELTQKKRLPLTKKNRLDELDEKLANTKKLH